MSYATKLEVENRHDGMYIGNIQVVFEAEDGEAFSSLEDAEEHTRKLRQEDTLRALAATIADRFYVDGTSQKLKNNLIDVIIHECMEYDVNVGG